MANEAPDCWEYFVLELNTVMASLSKQCLQNNSELFVWLEDFTSVFLACENGTGGI